ncbi:MAG: ATP-dependent helicase [Rickettsiales bacterium]
MQPIAAPMMNDDETPSYLNGLNPEQKLAVETTEGPLLVLSGAGTGKTRVLTTRIAHLIHTKRAYPGQILSVTFTNKAAAEMRERVSKHLFGAEADAKQAAALWLGTFHSIGAKMLRRHAELVGLTPQFTILDDDDQQRLIKGLLADQNIDHTKFPTRAVQNVIQGWKDRGLIPDKINEQPGNYTITQVGAKIYPLYQNRLRALNCCDFGDLLLHVLVIFQTHPDVLRSYAERFRYILVDEYQDTNVAQYLWLRLLAAYHKNLCCVGDDDQSIYGWRGAEVGNILKFEHDYPGAKTIKLERNYRSTSAILATASGLIANNKTRLGKTLWTDADEEHIPVRVKSVWDDSEEARFVGEEIESFQRNRIALKQMAVLVRTGFQTRAFEERFLTLAIPYKVVGGLRFYERMEIRDAIAYLRIINQPHDDLALERVINTPKRGIGKATMELLHVEARRMNGSLYSAIQQMLDRGELKGKTATTLDKLLKQFESWRERGGIKLFTQTATPSTSDAEFFASPLAGEATRLGEGGSPFTLNNRSPLTQPSPAGEEGFPRSTAGAQPEEATPFNADILSPARPPGALSLAELADIVLEESGYRAMWQADTSPEAAGRLDNIRELVRALVDYPNLSEFLEHVGLVTEGAQKEDGDMVNIMSLHAAKGLEFDAVFLTGWEEGLFPSQRTMDELGTEGLEEERRLAYVGITRARQHLTISHAANRRIYNQYQSNIPSRFLGEIPADHLEHLDGGPYSKRATGPAMFQREVEAILGNSIVTPGSSRGLPPRPAQHPSGDPGKRGRDNTATFTKGTRVFHQKFGNGVILASEGDHLEIAFKHAGVKKILAEYVELAG